MKHYASLADALDDLKKRGYEADFEPQSNSLYGSDLDLRLEEEEFHIDEVYHFAEGPNHNDSTVVYAFTSPTGVKGTIVDGHVNPQTIQNLFLKHKHNSLWNK